MASKPKPASSVVPLFGRGPETDPAEEVSVGRNLFPPAAPSPTRNVSAVDLTGRAKILMALGSGNVGKTTFLRFIGETALRHDAELVLAAVDPENRSLADYFAGVEMPPSYEPAAVAAWLERFLRGLMDSKATAAIDFGGGDTSLAQVIASGADLVAMMAEAEVEPVAVYVMGPRVDDLSPLATFEAAGFKPRATLLLLNEGLADPTIPREQAFSAILRHSVYKAAVARGAVQLWMPRLIPAREVEVRRILFNEARDAIEPEGRRVSPLGPFDRARVRLWMDRMSEELEAVRSWLPA